MSVKLVSALAGVIFVSLASPSFAKHPVDVNDKTQVELGKNVYQDNCVSCHGANRQGPENLSDFSKRKPPRLDSKGHGFHHGDNMHFEQIVKGSRDESGNPVNDGMAPFGDVLSKQEIWATIAYIKSHWPIKMRKMQDNMNPGHEIAHKDNHDHSSEMSSMTRKNTNRPHIE